MLNVNIYKSTDAGKTWKAEQRAARRQPRHVDRVRRLEPDDRSERRRRQRSRSTAARPGRTEPMPTAQFYHVITTKHVPYHVCGAQQDNSTACVSSEPPQGGPGGSGGGADQVFYSVGGGESGYIAQRPAQPRHLLRRQLRRPDHAPGSAHRPGARRSIRIRTTRWATRRPTSRSASSGRSRS